MPTRMNSYREAKQAGMVMVGEWGWGERGAGAIWCMPEDREAVQAAYDAIKEGDLGPDVLSGVERSGGVYVSENQS